MIRHLILATTLASLSFPASAQYVVCQSLKTCDSALECQPWDSVLEVTIAKDGVATMMWDGKYPFTAKALQDLDPLIIVSNVPTTSAMSFVMSGNGSAIYTSAGEYEGGLISGVYSLKCTPAVALPAEGQP